MNTRKVKLKSRPIILKQAKCLKKSLMLKGIKGVVKLRRRSYLPKLLIEKSN